MLKKHISVLLSIILLTAMNTVPVFGSTVTVVKPNYQEALTDWKIESSRELQDDAVIQKNHDTSAWTDAKVPGTVAGALVDAGKYDHLFGGEDVYYNDNFSKIPRADFEVPWWYSTDFNLPQDQAGKKVTLTFEGINYVAEIYVNGERLENNNISVSSDMLFNRPPQGENVPPTNANEPGAAKIAHQYEDFSKWFIGAFRTYDLDITDYVAAGGNNIKVKVTRPSYSNDLTIYWVDWYPQPADNNMGLIGDAFVTTSGGIRLSNPMVTSDVSVDNTSADLRFFVDANNLTAADVSGTLKATVRNPAGEIVASLSKEVVVAANAYCQELGIALDGFENPALWWPHLSGDQPLYTVAYEFVAGGVSSDKLDHRFGIREITSEVNTSPFAMGTTTDVSRDKAPGTIAQMLQIYVNHKPILLKGGGYSPTDLMFRQSEEDNRAVVDYVKYMGYNMIRDEGKFFDDEFMDMLDEEGIINMPGWCCCDRWQQPHRWNQAERFIAFESLYSQIRTARAHASTGVWFNGSDNPPGYSDINGQVIERAYFEIEANLRWFDHGSISSSGSAIRSTYTGSSSGMHMDATYDYEPPVFSYVDPRGAYGFVSEGGGGASLSVVETIRRFIPEDKLWPYNVGANFNTWNYHAARGSFGTINIFNRALDNRYGESVSIDDYLMKAQIQEYDTFKSQFESFNVHRFTEASGIVTWMLNNAAPGIFWNTFDFYHSPNGSTYGSRIANEPVHIMYDPYNREISVINNTFDSYPGMTAEAAIYDIHGNVIGNLSAELDIAPDGHSESVDFADWLPKRDQKTGLRLNDGGAYEDVNFTYFGKVEEAYGVNKLWDSAAIDASLTSPTTDVYFIRLALKGADGKAVSINTYAVPMKNDIIKLSSHNWSSTPQYEYADLTQLNELPPVALDVVHTATANEDGMIAQTLSLTNDAATNDGNIAYAIELKTYNSATKTELVAPIFYSDNLFTLFPGETREITVSYDADTFGGTPVFSWTCYNNTSSRVPAREVPLRSSRNLALNKAVTTSGGGTAGNAVDANAAAIAAGVLDSDVSTNWANSNDATNPWIYVDLGAPTAFDRVMLRWNYANRPDRIAVEISDDAETWTEVAVINNTAGASSMNDVILAETVNARYVRILPTGYRALSPAVGVVSGATGGVNQAAAIRQFQLTGFEVYAFKVSAFLELATDGKITVDAVDYTAENTANERVVSADAEGNLTLQFTPKAQEDIMLVYVNGEDVTADLDEENQLVLTGLTEDIVVRAETGRDVASVEGISIKMQNQLAAFSDKYEPVFVIADAGANPGTVRVYAAAYDSDGKLAATDLLTADITGQEYVVFRPSLDIKPGFSYKCFIWDGDYRPLALETIIE